MFATTEEINLYARMTLKQWKLADVKIEWMTRKDVLGLAYADDWKIELSELCLSSFACFRETLLHEMAHLLDFQERGTYVVNTREVAHGKNWRKWCKTLGIPARLKIPA